MLIWSEGSSISSNTWAALSQLSQRSVASSTCLTRRVGLARHSPGSSAAATRLGARPTSARSLTAPPVTKNHKCFRSCHSPIGTQHVDHPLQFMDVRRTHPHQCIGISR